MIKTFTAVTEEIDDIEAMLEDITNGLGLDNIVVGKSTAIISLSPDFIDTGVLKAVSDFLFENGAPSIGIATATNMAKSKASAFQMVVTLFVSDSPVVVGESADAEGDFSALNKSVTAAKEKLGEEIAFLIGFLPLSTHVDGMSGEYMLGKFSEAVGGKPIYGSMPVDYIEGHTSSVTFTNGDCFKERFSYVLFGGNYIPEFHIENIPEKNLNGTWGVITRSEANVIYEVDNVPIRGYMEALGLGDVFRLTMISNFPFYVDKCDGLPYTCRSIYYVDNEGGLVCGGPMHVGYKVTFGSISDGDDICNTAAASAETMKDMKFTFGISCIARLYTLSTNIEREFIAAEKQIPNVAHHFLYSGGEICPEKTADGKLVNKFHNASFCTMGIL